MLVPAAGRTFLCVLLSVFFFNDTATTEIYTLSLHDALPICTGHRSPARRCTCRPRAHRPIDRKSTRLNSSHTVISYAVFCLKKKKKKLVFAVNSVHATGPERPAMRPDYTSQFMSVLSALARA